MLTGGPELHFRWGDARSGVDQTRPARTQSLAVLLATANPRLGTDVGTVSARVSNIIGGKAPAPN